MRSSGINGEGELREQPANLGSPGKMAVLNGVCVCYYLDMICAFEASVLVLIVKRGRLGPWSWHLSHFRS